MDRLVIVKKKLKCHFCGSKTNNDLRYGPIYRLGNIRAHYYCVLLSNKLIQNGRDDEGMLGFLLQDIQNELQRTVNLICIYCGRGNATIACSAKKCRKNFHLPCGLRNGSLHQFIKQFKSFCRSHRPSQNIPEKILREARKSGAICCICYEKVQPRNKVDALWAPCCLKTWYHRNCVQKLAHSAGYFFRCAACNDVKKFKDWMQRFGIFIPQKDASWELVPNAFVELLYRYDRCDAGNCKCPDGRQKNAENTIWEIVLCETCGSQGMHIACGNLKFMDPEWECEACEKITKTIKTPATEVGKSTRPEEGSSMLLKLSEVSQKKRRRNSEDLENSVLDKRKRCRTNLVEDEVDIEVDVESVEEKQNQKETQTETRNEDADDIVELRTVEARSNVKGDFEEILTSLKPGPLSYKLSVLGEALNAPSSVAHEKENVRTTPTVIDVIDLTQADENEVDDDEIEIIEKDDTRGTSRHMETVSEDESCFEVVPIEEVMRDQKKYSSHFEIVTAISIEQPKSNGDEEGEDQLITPKICNPSSVKGCSLCAENATRVCDWKPIKTDHTKEIKAPTVIEDERKRLIGAACDVIASVFDQVATLFRVKRPK